MSENPGDIEAEIMGECRFFIDGTCSDPNSFDGESRYRCCPSTRFLGLTLLGRLFKQLHRFGVKKVIVYLGELHDKVQAQEVNLQNSDYAGSLKESPVGLEVELKRGRVPDDRVKETLKGYGIYENRALNEWVSARIQGDHLDEGEPPECVVPDSPEKIRAQKKRLWGAAGKSVSHDGLVAYYVGRPLGRVFSKLLVYTSVSPNMVTVASMLVGLAGATVAGTGTYVGFVLGAFLYWFGMVVDCIDGDLARVKLCGSRLGQWLDTIADDVSTCSITVGFGVGLYFQTGHVWVLIAGVVGGLSIVYAAVHIYRGLVNLELPIDTAAYPWFFLGDGGVVKEDDSSEGGFGWLTYLVRRDFSSAVYVVLSLFGLAFVAFGIMVIGALVTASLAFTDMVVKRRDVS